MRSIQIFFVTKPVVDRQYFTNIFTDIYQPLKFVKTKNKGNVTILAPVPTL